MTHFKSQEIQKGLPTSFIKKRAEFVRKIILKQIKPILRTYETCGKKIREIHQVDLYLQTLKPGSEGVKVVA